MEIVLFRNLSEVNTNPATILTTQLNYLLHPDIYYKSPHKGNLAAQPSHRRFLHVQITQKPNGMHIQGITAQKTGQFLTM